MLNFKEKLLAVTVERYNELINVRDYGSLNLEEEGFVLTNIEFYHKRISELCEELDVIGFRMVKGRKPAYERFEW